MSAPDTAVDIYERLAQALDEMPQGFPRTESGVELELIKMAFTPEEVALAGQLTRTPETAAEIAQRTGLDETKVTAILDSLVPRRLVRLDSPGMAAPGLAPTITGEKKYRLGPFMVGWYEAGMRLLGKEFAEAFEQYVVEGGGERILAPRPGSLGVVPLRGTLKPEWLEREPHNDIDAHFQRHDRFLVIDCVCKREVALLQGHSCDQPIKRCGFVGLPPQTPLGENVLNRNEASKLLTELEQMGHVHLAFYGFTMGAESPQFVGTCNCCDCCCGILHGQKISGVTESAQRSNYRAVIAADKCISCGVCIGRCPVDAITDDPSIGASKVEREKCIGCGVCVVGCASAAIEMQPVSEEEWFQVPSSFDDWEKRRLEYLTATK